ncbi:MAG: hypothetical protein M3Z05_14800 [Gemmatimonadota bacterium]|nr:hypothetical protein [Gemmatimonadota bacterium]
MLLQDETYNEALDIFHEAVAAFCRGDHERGESLLGNLNTEAIERDRKHLLALARTAKPSTAPTTAVRAVKSVSREIREAVQLRDRFRCRFTGRRLIDTRVFQEVSRLSAVLHFDEHHAVYETARGRGGHPLVRTHGAAYEHAQPLSHGGQTTTENIFHISVQLNESKGANVLERVEVPSDGWNGLTEYLARLGAQQSAARKPTEGAQTVAHHTSRTMPLRRSASVRKAGTAVKVRQAAEGLAVTVFALADGAEVEHAFLELRRAKKNAFFANERKAGMWMIHRMYCSSLAFDIAVKLTASPKVYSENAALIHEWARRAEVVTTECSRCRNAV